jgi:hypothetical protein
MGNVIPIAAPGITAAPLRLQNTVAQFGNAGSNGASSSGSNLQQNLQRPTVKTATAKARTPITLTTLPAGYSPSFDAGAAGAGGTSVNVNLVYEIVQQIRIQRADRDRGRPRNALAPHTPEPGPWKPHTDANEIRYCAKWPGKR